MPALGCGVRRSADGLLLLLGAGLGQAVGVGAGFDDGSAEGEAVDDRGAKPGSVKVLVQPPKDSLEATPEVKHFCQTCLVVAGHDVVDTSSRG